MKFNCVFSMQNIKICGYILNSVPLKENPKRDGRKWWIAIKTKMSYQLCVANVILYLCLTLTIFSTITISTNLRRQFKHIQIYMTVKTGLYGPNRSEVKCESSWSFTVTNKFKYSISNLWSKLSQPTNWSKCYDSARYL